MSSRCSTAQRRHLLFHPLVPSHFYLRRIVLVIDVHRSTVLAIDTILCGVRGVSSCLGETFFEQKKLSLHVKDDQQTPNLLHVQLANYILFMETMKTAFPQDDTWSENWRFWSIVVDAFIYMGNKQTSTTPFVIVFQFSIRHDYSNTKGLLKDYSYSTAKGLKATLQFHSRSFSFLFDEALRADCTSGMINNWYANNQRRALQLCQGRQFLCRKVHGKQRDFLGFDEDTVVRSDAGLKSQPCCATVWYLRTVYAQFGFNFLATFEEYNNLRNDLVL